MGTRESIREPNETSNRNLPKPRTTRTSVDVSLVAVLLQDDEKNKKRAKAKKTELQQLPVSLQNKQL